MRYLILLHFLLSAIVSSAQTKDCKRFKNGTFRIDDPETGTSTIITRKGAVQHERMGDSEARLKVVWLNDCTYTLELMTGKKSDKKHMKESGFDRTMVVKVEILETAEDYYVQRATAALYDVVFESKVFKIK